MSYSEKQIARIYTKLFAKTSSKKVEDMYFLDYMEHDDITTEATARACKVTVEKVEAAVDAYQLEISNRENA